MSRKCRIAALVAMFGMALAACSPAPDADAAANDTIIEADTGAVVVRPIAGTQYGDVMGTVEDGISVFLGIPYGCMAAVSPMAQALRKSIRAPDLRNAATLLS